MRFSVSRFWGVQATAVAAMLLGVAAINHLMPGPSLGAASLIAALILAGCAFALYAYRFADEIIFQTDKTAWFWGALAGAVLFAPIAIFANWHLLSVPLVVPSAQDTHAAYFVQGGVLVIVLECAGFAVVRAIQYFSQAKL
ncbi:hypothetical protein FHS83_000397 [Rhizomicrobium palustre]|uniref:Uncharacterized protein n=1 Tax=Rhizomicrobium palustre TaxID=189966 RepID=A0A846MV22_9PROT|nr:hypothetical protein [Rhizomicrobium palustre]NIK87079.1 hypothetical protein [Rhizomicrobium palustre]